MNFISMYKELQEQTSLEIKLNILERKNTRISMNKNLKEKLIRTEKFDMFLTESAYEAKNYILSHLNDDGLRVYINEHVPLYLVGKMYECIHTDMVIEAQKQGYDVKMNEDDDKIVCVIISPIDSYGFPVVDKEDTYYDDYTYEYYFEEENIYAYSRYQNFKKFDLCKAFGKARRFKLTEDDKITESIRIDEKSRRELINKSRGGDNYTSKEREGQNRWTRRTKSRIFNSIRDYNDIDMNAFWKGNILQFGIKVHGETDDYVVTVIFENILENLQRNIKDNDNKLEFKCVLRALLTSFNSGDVYISCTCPDFVYSGMNYYSYKQGYNSNPIFGKAMTAPVQKNPDDTKGAGCKHINLVISNLDWMMKIASVINNYIRYAREHFGTKYADFIFPQVYGVPYDRAIQLSLFDDPNDNGLLPTDQDTISKAIDKTMSARDDRGKFVKDNEYRFQKREPEETDRGPSQEDENPLGLEFDDTDDSVDNIVK